MKIKKIITIILFLISIIFVASCDLSLPFIHAERDTTSTNTTTKEKDVPTTTTTSINLDIEFNDITYVYDGTIKKPTIKGDLPKGVELSYDYSKLSDKVGVYFASVDFINGEQYNLEKKYAKVTITKKKINLVDFDFETEFQYDGNPHFIYLNSKPINHLHVSYSNNIRTEVGQTKVKVTFSADSGYENCFEGLGDYEIYLIVSGS